MTTERQIRLLDDLQALLERQVELARRGNVRDVEALSKQANSLVGEIVRTGILERFEFKNRRERLQELCDSLCLAVTAQQADTAERLSWVRKGKKTIQTYRGSI